MDSFIRRHNGASGLKVKEMLDVIKVSSLDELILKTVPSSIRMKGDLNISNPLTEPEMLLALKKIAKKNKVFKSYIGRGYYSSILPSAIRRSILENPGWYTQYTPYQAEISQGRLEALLNFQTMVCELSGMDISNASLLDEGTAAAEAMSMLKRKERNKEKNVFLVCKDIFSQTLDVLKTRAEPIGIRIKEFSSKNIDKADFKNAFGAILQYPSSTGEVIDYRGVIKDFNSNGIKVVLVSDLLSLLILKSPGDLGASVTVGSSGRFGCPLFFGGPHASFLATLDEYKRDMPGRVVGVSKDASSNKVYRLSLQTREQHIRRDKATSNICTAQVLLGIISSMYAVYHGPKGLRNISKRVSKYSLFLAKTLESFGLNVLSKKVFDSIYISFNSSLELENVIKKGIEEKINFYKVNDLDLSLSLDETTTKEDLVKLVRVLAGKEISLEFVDREVERINLKDEFLDLYREEDYLKHKVFNAYHSETEFVRYIERLRRKDLSLEDQMIPLGSCTMKLNSATSMLPVLWEEFSSIHPLAPEDQILGYKELIKELEKDLAEITGMEATSLQPNSGAQGEYAGLLAIRRYHLSRGEGHRNICLIPKSAHGTNLASAVMAGMKVVNVLCDKEGNVDILALEKEALKHKENLSSFMITYPSTHGVFESEIKRMCDVVHKNGGMVYLDGANMNAMVSLCRPGDLGADVCHLNLHKTFSMPHGGGGPGIGPICVNKKLKDFLPQNVEISKEKEGSFYAVSSSMWGSAGFLPIPFSYIKMMGASGLKEATKLAILNANYVAKRLEKYFPVLYKGENGFVAHECILDCRGFKKTANVEVNDIAKRLMDYGFHAPTVSFPVSGTLMVEPTESESKEELDRFCESMIRIREEIEEIENGDFSKEDNVLKNAPHTVEILTSDNWDFSYSREKAAYPLSFLRENKFWPSVRRIDDVYGDRNLCCVL